MPDKDWEDATWGDLLQAIHDMGFADDEYFGCCHYLDPKTGARQTKSDDLLYTDDVCYHLAFWVVGGSEGYYVHVGVTYRTELAKPPCFATRLVGKFWDWERAVQATAIINLWLTKI